MDEHERTTIRAEQLITVPAGQITAGTLGNRVGEYRVKLHDPTLEELARAGWRVADALNAYNLVVAMVRQGLADAGVDDAATVDRLAEAICKRLAEV